MAKTAGQTHEVLTREEVVKGSSDRSFGITFAAVALLLAGIWHWHERPAWIYALGLSVVFLVLALAAPRALAPLNQIWLKLGLLLHRAVNPLVMGLLFYGCITPMALVIRLMGKDMLRLKFDRQAPTYWIKREPPGPAPDTMKHQF